MTKRSVSIRELQQELRRVLERVQRGEAIEVTRHRRVVATLVPVQPAADDLPPWPDFEARARVLFGARRVSPAASAVVIEGRGNT